MSKNEPMGGDLGPSRGTGVPHVNAPRQCWALKTLVAEMAELFPETPVEYSNVDGRNTALDVTFDCSMLGEEDQILLVNLFRTLEVDARVSQIMVGNDQMLVSMKSDSRTQDLRDPFGLADAWGILTDEDDGDEDENLWLSLDELYDPSYPGIFTEALGGSL